MGKPDRDPAAPAEQPPEGPARPERPGQTIDDDPRWTAVSPERPCPVCGGTDTKCGIALDEGVVDCQRVPSAHPIEGGGWLHQLGRPGSRRGRARPR
jgi:hypothetical protein